MRLVVYIYYFIFLLTGGFRNYYEEALLQEACQGIVISHYMHVLLYSAGFVLAALCMAVLAFPAQRKLHLLFFAVLFCIDLYFQNFVNFEDYNILVHSFPLMVFCYLYAQDKQLSTAAVDEILVLVIATGYFANFIAKLYSGWLSPDTPVVYTYVALFHYGFGVHWHGAGFFLKHGTYFLYKLADYFVLAFQLSAVLLFYRTSFFKWFSIVAVFFHVCVMLFMEIAVFYPYILVYTLVIADKSMVHRPGKTERYIVFALLALYLTGLLLSGFDRYFVLRNLDLNVYIYHNTFLTVFSTMIFLFTWRKVYNTKNSMQW